MSLRSKFPSNASTPAKLKHSEGSGSVSSMKSFLTSVLTPSHRKKWIKRKKTSKSKDSLDEVHPAERNIPSNETIDDLNDPNYSSVEELHLKLLSPGEIALEEAPSPVPVIIHEASHNLQLHASGEPIYATVNKQKKNKSKVSNSYENHQDGSINGASERNVPVNLQLTTESDKFCPRNIEDDFKEEIKLLTERLKDVTNENRELRKNIEDLLKEKKWKDDSVHAELKLRISQLETETHKEVRSLSEQVTALQKERKVLLEKIDILHQENKSLKAQCDDLSAKAKSMISPEFVAKTVDELQRSMVQLEKTHQDKIQKLVNEKKLALESKISLSTEVRVLKERLRSLVTENETLKANEGELIEEKSQLCLQLGESKQMQEEIQSLLVALLKLTESISIERDVLLDKVSYHDNQQILMKTSIMDYSLNVGRLQEHISNFTKEKFDELQKLKVGGSVHDANVKNFYNGQLELLRSKVLNQNTTISDLESEKGKLESQLESLWHAACIGKPKLLEDFKYGL